MQLRYEEDFIEAAAFLCASGRRHGVASLQIARFHRERESLYRILDPDARNSAFFKLHLDWFREWGLEKLIIDLLKEFPRLQEELAVLALRKSRAKSDDGAELYVNEAGQRSAILALRPEQLASERSAGVKRIDEVESGSAGAPPAVVGASPTTLGVAPMPDNSVAFHAEEPTGEGAGGVHPRRARSPNLTLTDFLRHEFMHLNDMLDPAFGYSPTIDLPGLNGAQQRLARERYRLLWDITIDGRLAAAGHTPMVSQAQHATAFARGYSFWPEARQQETFDALWHKARPHHAEFLGLIADPRGWRDAHRPAPGASCPLCDFPTFTWADTETLPSAIIARIKLEFSNWSPEQGLCGRCLETYEAAADLQLQRIE